MRLRLLPMALVSPSWDELIHSDLIKVELMVLVLYWVTLVRWEPHGVLLSDKFLENIQVVHVLYQDLVAIQYVLNLFGIESWGPNWWFEHRLEVGISLLINQIWIIEMFHVEVIWIVWPHLLRIHSIKREIVLWHCIRKTLHATGTALPIPELVNQLFNIPSLLMYPIEILISVPLQQADVGLPSLHGNILHVYLAWQVHHLLPLKWSSLSHLVSTEVVTTPKPLGFWLIANIRHVCYLFFR